MDLPQGVHRYAEVLLSSFVCLFFGYTSIGEWKYLLWGKTAEATVTQTEKNPTYPRSGPPMLGFEFQFTDADGQVRRGRASTEVYSEKQSGQVVAVQYLPGAPDSHRLQRNASWLTINVFIGCLVLLGISVYRLKVGAHEEDESATEPQYDD